MTTQKAPDIDEIYHVLRNWALSGTPKTYKDLSLDYYRHTGEWFEPHGSWDEPLGEINNRLARADAPALSALVILQEKNEPGGKFWGSAPNVPPRPRNEITRWTEWDRIVKSVLAYDWPAILP